MISAFGVDHGFEIEKAGLHAAPLVRGANKGKPVVLGAAKHARSGRLRRTMAGAVNATTKIGVPVSPLAVGLKSVTPLRNLAGAF